MALIGCKECGTEISNKAKACPKCGCRLRITSLFTKIIAWFFGISFALAIIGAVNDDGAKDGGSKVSAQKEESIEAAVVKPEAVAPPAKPETAELSEEECRADDECWLAKHKIDGMVDCRYQIESHAEYDFEWTNGWLEHRYRNIYVGDGRVIHYVGESVKFQNGFGAWKKMKYNCAYNPDSGLARMVNLF